MQLSVSKAPRGQGRQSGHWRIVAIMRASRPRVHLCIEVAVEVRRDEQLRVEMCSTWPRLNPFQLAPYILRGSCRV
jgi:hypothetical protein